MYFAHNCYLLDAIYCGGMAYLDDDSAWPEVSTRKICGSRYPLHDSIRRAPMTTVGLKPPQARV